MNMFFGSGFGYCKNDLYVNDIFLFFFSFDKFNVFIKCYGWNKDYVVIIL